ncbi:hypothetical protein HNR46_000807 [Haloferula luteola]|uniref:DUF1593 domain-containing protein n=1 Tax=Haloferula luteola TaxID=595692 RepID=A0A840V9X0_9BACT|nr:nucleoside hydrolase-like domain-containing protein [Haloferula luteola]MBB5350579.1 hypothetical protein [Haloferula luteola]
MKTPLSACRGLTWILYFLAATCAFSSARPRVLVTTDGEADDRCSMVRFLLSCNEFDVEGIVNSSSQFHWQGGQGWNAFHDPTWVRDSVGLYQKVYDQLRIHDPAYPHPDLLLSKWKIGNIQGVGEDQERSEGAEWIAQVLLDDSDTRPLWIQAWGGCNTLARALRIIQEEHPDRMTEVATRLRLFLIWEQDETYQKSIRPVWEPLGVTTIISDQFDCMAYIWPKVLPDSVKTYLEADWMKKHLLRGHGPLASSYEALDGAFHAEGDTPAFLHAIPNGLRSLESPAWGGWGGRYIEVRPNVWMDPPPAPDWKHPEGQISIHNSWSKKLENVTDPAEQTLRTHYFKPIWRWLPAVQNDFAARADWCVKDYASANHPPQVKLKDTPLDLFAVPGETLTLDASATRDPDGDSLQFQWWAYLETSQIYPQNHEWESSPKVTLTFPAKAQPGEALHMICEVTDNGSPPLTRYQRVVIRAKKP